MEDISEELLEKYEFNNYQHAAEILKNAYPNEYKDIMDMLNGFKIYTKDIMASGGSETAIPGRVESFLYPRKWRNTAMAADLHIKLYERKIDVKSYEEYPSSEPVIYNYLSNVRVDYLKNHVAVSLEWNKKDVSYDRVLTALRAFYEARVVDVAVIITRSDDLDDNAFQNILGKDGKPVKSKYGASSTHMSRLIPKLDSRLAGGCPIWAIGIKSGCIVDYNK